MTDERAQRALRSNTREPARARRWRRPTEPIIREGGLLLLIRFSVVFAKICNPVFGGFCVFVKFFGGF